MGSIPGASTIFSGLPTSARLVTHPSSGYGFEMQLTAEELKPLLGKLSHEERVRLARMALARPQDRSSSDAHAYERHPIGPDEFSTDEPDPFAWESTGWDHIK